MSGICRSRSPTISSSSAPASAGSRPRGSSDSVTRTPRSCSWTTTTTSAATPSATSSRSRAVSCWATAAPRRCSLPRRCTGPRPRACCGRSASTTTGSSGTSTPTCTRRWGCRARSSLPRRPSARIGSSPATRCGWWPTTSPPIACTSGRPRRSSRTSRCRTRPRRSCSSSTRRRAIPFPPCPRPRRSSTCRGPATASTCRRSGGSPTRRPIRSRGGHTTSSRSGSTTCRRSTPWKPATRASPG